ncbi:MAG: hypothetical protein ABJA76_12570, partial [Mucilaginibacter sp.]
MATNDKLVAICFLWVVCRPVGTSGFDNSICPIITDTLNFYVNLRYNMPAEKLPFPKQIAYACGMIGWSIMTNIII